MIQYVNLNRLVAAVRSRWQTVPISVSWLMESVFHYTEPTPAPIAILKEHCCAVLTPDPSHSQEPSVNAGASSFSSIPSVESSGKGRKRLRVSEESRSKVEPLTLPLTLEAVPAASASAASLPAELFSAIPSVKRALPSTKYKPLPSAASKDLQNMDVNVKLIP